jgi:hypothetical protein
MIGATVPEQLKLLQVADLPFVVDSGFKPHHLRCQGFRAEDAGTVAVTMLTPGAAAATAHVLPCNSTSGMQWLGDIKSITAFVGTTKIWLYLTANHS